MREIKEKIQGDIVIIPRRKRTPPTANPLTFRDILLRSLGFLAARAVPIPGLAPFGVAYLSAERTFSPGSVVTFVMVVLGYLSLGDWFCLRYISAAAAVMGGLTFLEKSHQLSTKTICVLSAGILLLFHAFSILWTGFSFPGLLAMLTDPAMAVLGILAFDRCRPLLTGKTQKNDTPSPETRLSVWLLSALSLMSLRNFWWTDWFSLAHIAGFVVLGILAISGGFHAAVLAGPVLGILLGFGGEFLPVLALFSFCGLVCGLTGRLHKYAVSGALAFSGLLLAFYIHGSHAPILRYLESSLGAGILLLLPDRFFLKAKPFAAISPGIVPKDTAEREQLQTKLALAADSFRTLADTFGSISDREEQPDSREVAALFDLAASQVCRTCSKAGECWRRNFNATYQTLCQLLDRLERKGAVRKIDVDPFFSERCLKLDAFLTEINRLYEIHKINQIWKQKLCENRLLIGEQFGGVADILNRIGSELRQDADTAPLMAEQLDKALEKQGIYTEGVSISRGMDGRQQVQVTLSRHRKGDTALLLSVLQQILGKNFSLVPGTHPASPVFQETPSLAVTAASASSQKEEECGDAHRLNHLPCGKYIATLSDGMGTGCRASRESNATISLLNAFLNAGFDKTVAVKLINSVMVMKSAKEAFTTLDLCMIDLCSGEAEFVKNGAEPSYIKRKNGTETIRSASLPVGVLSGVEAETFSHTLTAGDMIVMVSDGLSLKDSGGDWLRHAIDAASLNIAPQELADEILSRAVTLKGGEADDDMTVLVLRLDQAL